MVSLARRTGASRSSSELRLTSARNYSRKRSSIGNSAEGPVTPTPSRTRSARSIALESDETDTSPPGSPTRRSSRNRSPGSKVEQKLSALKDSAPQKRNVLTASVAETRNVSTSMRNSVEGALNTTPSKTDRKRRHEEISNGLADKTSDRYFEGGHDDADRSIMSVVRSSVRQGRKIFSSLADAIVSKKAKTTHDPSQDIVDSSPASPISEISRYEEMEDDIADSIKDTELIFAELEKSPGFPSPRSEEEKSPGLDPPSNAKDASLVNSSFIQIQPTDLQKVKRRVLGQLNGRLRPRLVGLEDAYG